MQFRDNELCSPSIAFERKGRRTQRRRKKLSDKLCKITHSDILSRFQHENLKKRVFLFTSFVHSLRWFGTAHIVVCRANCLNTFTHCIYFLSSSSSSFYFFLVRSLSHPTKCLYYYFSILCVSLLMIFAAAAATYLLIHFMFVDSQDSFKTHEMYVHVKRFSLFFSSFRRSFFFSKKTLLFFIFSRLSFLKW